MECQVVVVGDAKVGKTALIRRLTQNEFFEVMTHRNLELTRANRSVDQYARCALWLLFSTMIIKVAPLF